MTGGSFQSLIFVFDSEHMVYFIHEWILTIYITKTIFPVDMVLWLQNRNLRIDARVNSNYHLIENNTPEPSFV